MATWLTQANGFAFRIVHIQNLAAVLSGGLHARNAPGASASYVNIGNAQLIDKRGYRPVPLPPGGVLNNYVPFYFTPYSPMAYNIKTGYNVPKRSNDEIIILVAKYADLVSEGLTVLFTDRHAYLQAARYFSDAARLDQIDWILLQSRSFRRDPSDPEKMDRYQAELLVHGHVPLTALSAIVTHSPLIQHRVQSAVHAVIPSLKVSSVPEMYF